jgi:hypothetical protein
MLSTAILIIWARRSVSAGVSRPDTSNLLFSFHYLSPLVEAAFGTSLMWLFGLLALWADTWSYRLQKVMRAAFSAARF